MEKKISEKERWRIEYMREVRRREIAECNERQAFLREQNAPRVPQAEREYNDRILSLCRFERNGPVVFEVVQEIVIEAVDVEEDCEVPMTIQEVYPGVEDITVYLKEIREIEADYGFPRFFEREAQIELLDNIHGGLMFDRRTERHSHFRSVEIFRPNSSHEESLDSLTNLDDYMNVESYDMREVKFDIEFSEEKRWTADYEYEVGFSWVTKQGDDYIPSSELYDKRVYRDKRKSKLVTINLDNYYLTEWDQLGVYVRQIRRDPLSYATLRSIITVGSRDYPTSVVLRTLFAQQYSFAVCYKECEQHNGLCKLDFINTRYKLKNNVSVCVKRFYDEEDLVTYIYGYYHSYYVMVPGDGMKKRITDRGIAMKEWYRQYYLIRPDRRFLQDVGYQEIL